MKKILNFFISMQTMGAMLVIYAVSMAVATFVENDYGAITAKAAIYNSWWFNILHLLLVINMIGNIFIYKLYSLKKLPMFIFHVAFIIVISGAAVTRFVSYEGTMHIRENDSSNKITTEKTFVSINAQAGDKNYTSIKSVLFSPITKNRYTESFTVDGNDVKIKNIAYFPNATYNIVKSDNGNAFVSFAFSDGHGREDINLEKGNIEYNHDLSIGFDIEEENPDILITHSGSNLFIRSASGIEIMNMMASERINIPADSTVAFDFGQLYTIENASIVLKDFKESAAKQLVPNISKDANGLDACQMEITVNDQKEVVEIWGKSGVVQDAKKFNFNGVSFELYYGSMYYYLPFSIKLNDFQLDRYPGSMSPSSYASEVTLIDQSKNVNMPYRIFMNHVLDYRGYRFFQSSYDRDEKGTILSVNHDKLGTFLSYLGYILLAIGMFSTLFNKNSRFLTVARESSSLHVSRTAKILVAGLMLGFLSFTIPQKVEAQAGAIKEINKEHAKSFGELLVLDRAGRIKPVNTVASEMLRKVTRKDHFEGLNAEQVYLGIITFPEVWQHVKMITVSDPKVKKVLNLGGKYAAYSDIIDMQAQSYKLKNYVDVAYNKKPAEQNKFDKYIIKVDERLNVLYLAFIGDFLNIFPIPNDPGHKWAKVTDHAHSFTGEDSIFVSNIFPLYIQAVREATETGDYAQADEYLNTMKQFQKKYGNKILPSEKKIKMEIWYNNNDVFRDISFLYGIIGFVMLVFLFLKVLLPKIKVNTIVKISSVLIILVFAIHTYGLIIRWYISQHAPWSNGYESMIYIGWATVLAGIIFMKKSPISLSATALLTFLILFVAHMSWLDPQITNLVPVLNSYWLTIHVAIITASYGFLALGSLIGFLVLVLMIFRSKNNTESISATTRHLSLVNEMTLTVGLFLLTIGTFLGGVWANESWGRYWGWDPKETWALITVIVYSFIVHMRLIQGLKGNFAFNFASIVGYFSVLMTYFGVNYYLSGLHSYASGDPVPIPAFVYYMVAIILIVGILAYISEKKNAKLLAEAEK